LRLVLSVVTTSPAVENSLSDGTGAPGYCEITLGQFAQERILRGFLPPPVFSI